MDRLLLLLQRRKNNVEKKRSTWLVCTASVRTCYLLANWTSATLYQLFYQVSCPRSELQLAFGGSAVEGAPSGLIDTTIVTLLIFCPFVGIPSPQSFRTLIEAWKVARRFMSNQRRLTETTTYKDDTQIELFCIRSLAVWSHCILAAVLYDEQLKEKESLVWGEKITKWL